LGLGFGASSTFVATMDDLVYANLKKNVILPFQLARINGDNKALV
jgi:hypothetical protein